MTVCKTKVISDNMESKWIFFIFAYFSLCMNHKYTHIHAEENISDIYFDQISRLRNCQRRTSEKVVNITVLLPNVLPESGASDSIDDIWTKKNSLSLVLPGIALAARNHNDTVVVPQSFPNVSDILPGWKISIKYADTHCTSTFGPLEAVRLRCETDVFLGPTCPYVLAPVARFSNIWKIPVITTSGMEVDFRDKKEYPIITLSGTYVKFAAFTEQLLKKYNWRVVSFLYEGSKSGKGRTSCSFTLDTVFTRLVTNNVSTEEELKTQRIDDYYYSAMNKDANDTIKFIEENSRVVIMCASPSKVRDILLAAEALGMMEKGEYVFFNVELFTSQSSLSQPWKLEGASAEENRRAKKAYESVLTVTASSSSGSNEYESFQKAVKQLSKEKFDYDYDEPVNNFVANFHDAVLLYATALNEVVEEDGIGAKSDGEKIIKRMWNRTITGVTGNVTIDDNGDRSADYSLLDMDPNTGNFRTVAVYNGLNNEFKMVGNIHWPNRDSAPPDMPKCGFNNEKCDNKNQIVYIVISVVMTVLVLIFALLVLVIYRHYKLEADLANMTWKIAWEDLQSTKLGARGQFGSRFSLGRMSLAEMSQTSFDSMGCAEAKKQIFVKTCIYKGTIVAIKKLDKDKIDLSRKQLVELKRMKDINHDHLVRFIGACIEPPNCCLITEYCPRGSLQDILEDEDITLEWNFRYSLVHDIVKAMHFIHLSELKTHGNLKSSNCVVDSRFVLKVTDYSLKELRDDNEDIEDYYAYWKRKFWTAPELLRHEYYSTSSEKNGNTNTFLPASSSNSIVASQKGDVYSFAIILHEIVMRQGPFYLGENLMMDPRDIVEGVRRCSRTPEVGVNSCSPGVNAGLLSATASGSESGSGAAHISSTGTSSKGILRPLIDKDSADEEIINMMTRCWSEDPLDRPDFSALKVAIRKLNKDNESGNILDNLLSRMEQYANNLEALVEERTADYLEEKRKAEDLLYELLPKSVAGQLIQGQSVIAEEYASVTIYFSDIVGFTALSAESTPLEVVDFLNDLYTCFDSIIGNFDVYKIETIGDAYMVVSGLPVKNGENHAREIARMSLRLLEAVKTFRIRHRPNKKLQLRIGLHTGPCCAGVVGVKMPRYCLFGDTVNTASRMESTGLPLKIHVSPFTKSVLDQFSSFILETRGETEMKGKGKMTTYWLLGEKDQVASQQEEVEPNSSEMNISSQKEIGATPSSGVADDHNSYLTSADTPLVASEISKKTHFVDNVSDVEDRNLDSINRSSMKSNPSEFIGINNPSEASQPSHHHNHPPAHIISNPMTSIDDQGQPPLQRNCVDFEDETKSTRNDAYDKNTVSKNASIKSTKSSSLSQPAQTKSLENEILEKNNEQIRVNSTITNFDSDSSGLMNNLGGKHNKINSSIQSSETEPLVKSPTGNGAATHPV